MISLNLTKYSYLNLKENFLNLVLILAYPTASFMMVHLYHHIFTNLDTPSHNCFIEVNPPHDVRANLHLAHLTEDSSVDTDLSTHT